MDIDFIKTVRKQKNFVKFDFHKYMSENLMTVQDISKVTGLSRTTIYNNIRSGWLSKEAYSKLTGVK